MPRTTFGDIRDFIRNPVVTDGTFLINLAYDYFDRYGYTVDTRSRFERWVNRRRMMTRLDWDFYSRNYTHLDRNPPYRYVPWFYDDTIHVSSLCGRVTSQTFDEDFFSCCECGSSAHNDNSHESRYGETICEDCYDNQNSGVVREYSTNVLDEIRNKFLFAPDERKEKKPRWLGVELEVVPRRNRLDVAEETLEAVKEFAILKEDGSLDEGGFEIVSVPGTYAWHKSGIWDDFFDGPAKNLKSFTTDCCGMHVHVDKKSLGNLSTGKLMVFVNSPHNGGFIAQLAGRYNGSYCRIDTNKTVVGGKPGYSTEHFNAVSNSYKGTVEVRIFKGNVSKAGFFRNLEFVDALCRWVPNASFGRDGLTYEKFANWFATNQMWATYPNLGDFLVKQGLIRMFRKPNRLAA